LKKNEKNFVVLYKKLIKVLFFFPIHVTISHKL